MMIQDYAMVECLCDNVPALEKEIRKLLKDGWVAYGSPMCGSPRGAGTRLYQAMVLPVPGDPRSHHWVSATATEPGRWERNIPRPVPAAA
jgi:hypothetical protein